MYPSTADIESQFSFWLKTTCRELKIRIQAEDNEYTRVHKNLSNLKIQLFLPDYLRFKHFRILFLSNFFLHRCDPGKKPGGGTTGLAKKVEWRLESQPK
jgi:hypothetical protein